MVLQLKALSTQNWNLVTHLSSLSSVSIWPWKPTFDDHLKDYVALQWCIHSNCSLGNPARDFFFLLLTSTFKICIGYCLATCRWHFEILTALCRSPWHATNIQYVLIDSLMETDTGMEYLDKYMYDSVVTYDVSGHLCPL